MDRIKVDSVEEAVRAAEQLKRSGHTYWFRGQAKNWPVRSSLARLEPEDRQLAMKKVRRYGAWINDTPGLRHLAANADSAMAVAQHYGLPTNFVDFTTRPQIAAFFASEKAGSATAGDLACIICLDVEDLKRFWQHMGEKYPPPEFLQIEVPDLWRLEVQSGCFLFCPYDDIERIYDFDRICFPNTHVFRNIGREEVYPKRQSQLEILLDQYFMNERMIEGGRNWDHKGLTQVRIETPQEDCDPDVFPNGLPEHASWSAAVLQPWLELHPELLADAQTEIDFRIEVRNPQDLASVAKSVAEQLLHDLLPLPGIRKKLVRWRIDGELAAYGLHEDFASQLAHKLARLWDGLRGLPYNDEDLFAGMGMCVAFAIALGGDFGNPDSQHWERAAERCLQDAFEVEFGAVDGSYSRGYVSAAGLASAIRPDIIAYVSSTWKQQIARNPRGILQTSWNAKKTFDFRLLTVLFAREIAPFQVLSRTTAVFYSPARLATLGLP